MYLLQQKKERAFFSFFNFFYTSLYLSIFFFLVYCTGGRTVGDRDERTSSSRRGDGVLRTAENSGSSNYSVRRWSRADFDGPRCDTDNNCEELCSKMFPRDSISKCEGLPEDMVEALFENYRQLERIRSASLKDVVDPAAFATILDIDSEAITELIRNRWELRDVKAFLNWVASDPFVVEALEDEDDNFELFKKVLLKLSNDSYSSNDVVVGLYSDIDRYAQTFLYKAHESNNENAFEFIFDFLDKECPNPKNCKLLVLCSREEIERRSSGVNNNSVCPYFRSSDYRRDKYCYIQGPNVWSYVNTLIEDNDLNDKDLESINLDEEFCDDFCDNNNCDRIDF